MRLFKQTNFKFIEGRYYFIGLSIILVFIGMAAILLRGGFNLGIDFTGGVLVQVRFDKMPAVDDLRVLLEKGNLTDFQIQTFPQKNTMVIQKKGSSSQIDLVASNINTLLLQSGMKFTLERKEYVGARVGKHLANQAFLAIMLSFAGIVIYVAIRFKNFVWGFAGVIALVHDVFITAGLFAVLNKEIDLTVVAALLTLAGYSINDTIVVFDRIRENMGIARKEKTPLNVIIDKSINTTLSRTVITSLTVMFVVLWLFFMGGEVLHSFALAMVFGVFIGTYSSIFVASPIVYEMYNRKKK